MGDMDGLEGLDYVLRREGVPMQSQQSQQPPLMSRQLVSPLLALAFVLGSLSFSSKAAAYFSVIDTGELIAPNRYQVGLESQVVLNEFEGMNFVGRFDAGIDESSSARAILGFGKVDFQAGAFYKYIPFPDVEGQPAIGFTTGLMLARVAGGTEFSLRFNPLVSKRFQTEIGDFVPYAALPLGLRNTDAGSFVPVQIVGGTEFRPLSSTNWSYFAEAGVNLSKAFSYISLAFMYRFDDSSGPGRAL
jgi:hypothetical protein